MNEFLQRAAISQILILIEPANSAAINETAFLTYRCISQNRYINSILRWIAKWDDKFYHHQAVQYIEFKSILSSLILVVANDSLTIYCKCNKKTLHFFSLHCWKWWPTKKRRSGKAIISARFNDKGFSYFISSFFSLFFVHGNFSYATNLLQKEFY